MYQIVGMHDPATSESMREGSGLFKDHLSPNYPTVYCNSLNCQSWAAVELELLHNVCNVSYSQQGDIDRSRGEIRSHIRRG